MTDGVTVRILGDDSDLNNKLASSGKALAKWSAVAVGAAAVGAAVLTKETAEAAREIKNLADLADIGTTQLQKYAAASRTVNVSQEELAQIFKDVGDKIGDFTQNKAGPLKDFFDNIAPQVGVTADEFARLSGPEALEKYVKALEDANVSQNEMTFYMEAIASESKQLTPLLINNAAEFKRLGEEAEASGAILSAIEVEQLDQLNVAANKAGQQITGIGNAISTTLSPALTLALTQMTALVAENVNFKEVTTVVFNSVITGIGFVGNAFRGVEVIVGGLNVAMYGIRAASASVFSSIVSHADEGAVALLEFANIAIDAVNSISPIDIERLVIGESEFVSNMEAMAATANQTFIDSKAQLHDLMMEDLPTTQFAAYVEAARLASEQAASLLVTDKEEKQAEQNSFEDDPELIAQRERFALLTESQELFDLAKSDKSKEFKAEELTSLAEFNEAVTALEEQQTRNRLNVATDMFGNLSTLMNTENKKLFEVGKVAALSSAIIDGYSAAVSSYAAGAAIGGPVLGAAYAATSVIATGVQIAGLSSTSFGGGSKPTQGGGGSVPSAPAAPAAPAEVEQRKTLRLEQFDPSGLFTGEALNSLAESLVQYQDDGFTLVR
jgi:hypothetical protein